MAVLKPFSESVFPDVISHPFPNCSPAVGVVDWFSILTVGSGDGDWQL
jgi:hypothetical protein